MFFTLDVRRARKGDCLILHYGTKKEPGLALIDGGPSNVYEPHLKPRLAEIREARGLDPDATLPVDWMMVSHIDDDHIEASLNSRKSWSRRAMQSNHCRSRSVAFGTTPSTISSATVRKS